MKLLLSRLLLASFCACSSWSVSSPGTSAVTQSPDVSVLEGGTVNISCCWTAEFQRLRVIWRKNQTDIKDEVLYLNNRSGGSQLNESSGCSHLSFTNVTRENSGRYICKVTMDIPYLACDVGDGTVITVMARDNTKDTTAGGSHPGEMFIFVLRCLLVLSLFITFFCIKSFATRAQQHTPAAPEIERTSAQRRKENREEEEK